MTAKILSVITCLLILFAGVNANTIILPGAYGLSPSDILVLN